MPSRHCADWGEHQIPNQGHQSSDGWISRNTGVIDHPVAREIIAKQMPLIVSEQHEDGGWGEHSFVAFRALHRHGFFGEKTD